jgi:hypothetical protein
MEYESKLKLINLVRNWPVLWQPTHKSYGKRGPRDVALKKVAVSLGEKGNMCFTYFN